MEFGSRLSLLKIGGSGKGMSDFVWILFAPLFVVCRAACHRTSRNL